MLILGLGILMFLLFRRRDVKHIPAGRILFAAFTILVAAYVFTVLESYYLPWHLNMLEHLCYAITSLLVAWYAFRTFVQRKGRR